MPKPGNSTLSDARKLRIGPCHRFTVSSGEGTPTRWLSTVCLGTDYESPRAIDPQHVSARVIDVSDL